MNKTYEELQQENINLKNECEKKDNQIKILKEKTLIYHSCKTLMDENTALKQQLEKSHDNYDRWIENTKEKLIKENIVISQQFNTVLDKILDRFAVNDNYGLMAGDMYDIASEAKTALDKIKEDN